MYLFYMLNSDVISEKNYKIVYRLSGIQIFQTIILKFLMCYLETMILMNSVWTWHGFLDKYQLLRALCCRFP